MQLKKGGWGVAPKPHKVTSQIYNSHLNNVAGLSSLFINFEMFKIYLKKLILWAIVSFMYTVALLDVAQNLSMSYLCNSKKKDIINKK